MTPAKTRSSNIELLRILAMFMIIIFHSKQLIHPLEILFITFIFLQGGNYLYYF